MRISTAALILTLGLASCGPRASSAPSPPAVAANAVIANVTPEASSADAAAANAAATNAAATATLAEAGRLPLIVGHGTGRVTAIDAAAGTVTIAHRSIPEAHWPAMTMTFASSTVVLNGIAVGDHVSFDLNVWGGHGEVTAIRKIS